MKAASLRRAALAVAVSLALGLAPTGAAALPAAFPILDDPAVIAALNAVANALAFINNKLMKKQRQLHEAIDKIERNIAFPNWLGEQAGVFHPIRHVVEEVKGIRKEVDQLSCGWKFSPRVEPFWKMAFTNGRVCRDEVRTLWGSAEGLPDADLHELSQYSTALTANMLAERSAKADLWEKTFRDMAGTVSRGAMAEKSPGQAARDTAFTVANMGKVTQNNVEMQAHKLWVNLLAYQSEERTERVAAHSASRAIAGLACLDGSCAQ